MSPRLGTLGAALPEDSIGKQYQTDPSDGDIAISVGWVSIARTSEHCWSLKDDYNFTPDKLTNLPYLSLWLEQFKFGKHAANFTVVSSGCVF